MRTGAASGRIASVRTRPTAALGRLMRSSEGKVAAMSRGGIYNGGRNNCLGIGGWGLEFVPDEWNRLLPDYKFAGRRGVSCLGIWAASRNIDIPLSCTSPDQFPVEPSQSLRKTNPLRASKMRSSRSIFSRIKQTPPRIEKTIAIF